MKLYLYNGNICCYMESKISMIYIPNLNQINNRSNIDNIINSCYTYIDINTSTDKKINMQITEKRKNKYHQIHDELKHRITNGSLGLGDQLPSEQELAASYGVSRLTVRQAISQLVSDGIVQSIQGKGSFVTPQVKTSETKLKTIHLLVSSPHEQYEDDVFNSKLLFQLCLQAANTGISLTVSILSRHQSLHSFMLREGIPATFRNGVILANIEVSPADLENLKTAGIPFVLLAPAEAGQPAVGTHDSKGLRDCIYHLLHYGHRKIAMMCCQPTFHSFDIMLMTYKEILAENKIAFDPNLLITATPWSEIDGRNAMKKLLSNNADFTSIVCFGDRASTGAMRVILEKGIKIPDDISVVVFDRYPWMDTALPFRISGTQQNFSGLAQSLLSLLEEERNSGIVLNRQLLISPDFVEGNSCGFCKD